MELNHHDAVAAILLAANHGLDSVTSFPSLDAKTEDFGVVVKDSSTEVERARADGTTPGEYYYCVPLLFTSIIAR